MVDWKKLLQQSGGVLIIALITYGSGWQYCLGLMHALGGSIYFVVPWNTALGRGFPGVATVSLIAILGYFVGYLARNRRVRWGRRAHLLLIIILVLVSAAPFIGELFRVPTIREELAVKHWRFIVVMLTTLLLTYAVAFRKIGKPQVISEYLMYAALLASFICATFYFSTLLGRSAVHKLPPAAVIMFNDSEMQRVYGNMLFVPIMEKEDELIMARCTKEEPTVCRPMIMRRALIKAVAY